MNVLHSAYHCYVNVGSFVGGTFVDEPQLEIELENAQELALQELEEGMQPTIRLEVQARRRFLKLERALHHSPVYGPSRRKELLWRWVQFSAFLPFLCNGGLSSFHLPWEYDRIEGEAFVTPLSTTDMYRYYVNDHCALRTYFVLSATRSFYHYMLHGHVERHRLRHRCMIRPTTPVYFEELVGKEWGFMVGEDIYVSPVLESCGVFSPGITAPTAVESNFNDNLVTWTLWTNPLQVLRPGQRIGDTATVSDWSPLRRRGSLIPLDLPWESSPDYPAAGSKTVLVLSVENPPPAPWEERVFAPGRVERAEKGTMSMYQLETHLIRVTHRFAEVREVGDQQWTVVFSFSHVSWDVQRCHCFSETGQTHCQIQHTFEDPPMGPEAAFASFRHRVRPSLVAANASDAKSNVRCFVVSEALKLESQRVVQLLVRSTSIVAKCDCLRSSTTD
jgi:hypothetical protein